MKFQGITIQKQKNCKTWYARFRQNGKQYFVSGKTQQECYNNLKFAMKNVGTPTQKKSITFFEWYNQWLDLYKQEVRITTKKAYSATIKYLKKLYEVPLTELSAIQILQELNQIEFERTKQKAYELLKDILTKAELNDLITKNPMSKIQKPKHKRINGSALSNEDEVLFENYCQNNNMDIFLVCLYQGLRKGEVLGLTMQDIDFEKKTISINKSLNIYNKLDKTKNENSIRTVPMFDKTVLILKKYLNKKGRIFEVSQSACGSWFDKIKQKLFPNSKYTIHSLRHTFITKCQENEIPLYMIQKWVGHISGSKVTNEIYTHARKDAEITYINKLNNSK